MSPLRLSATQAFWGLVGLAGGVVAALALLVVWQLPVLATGVWRACESAAQAVVGLLPALGLALPTALLIAGLIAALVVAWAQLHHTQRLALAVAERRIPWPDHLSHAVLGLEPNRRTLLVQDPRPYTFTLGLFRPRVWVSTGLVEILETAELQAVLRHERHHLARRDPLRVFVSRCLARLLFFVPLAPALRDAYLVAKEVEADAACGADDVLATALLKLLRCSPQLPAMADLAAIGPLDATAARIERLTTHGGQPPKMRRPWAPMAASLAVALVLLATGYFSTVRGAGPLTDYGCGYSAMPAPPALWQTPAELTPASSAQP